MRLVKLSILGALLAIASSALVGSPASASTELCLAHEGLACTGNPVETTHSSATTGTVVKLLGAITILCLGALVEAEVLEGGSPQELHATSLAFTGCGTGSAHNNCTVTTEELPSFELSKTGLDEGLLTAANGQVRLKCTNLGLNCLYDTEGLEFSAGAQHITAEEAPLTELGGKFLCPGESSLDALLESLEEAFILGPNQNPGGGPFWFENGVKIPAGKKVAGPVKGTMTFDIGGVIKIENCPYTATKTIFNGANVGEDELSKVAFTVPCKTDAGKCEVEKMVPQKLPWMTVLVKNNPPEDKLKAFDLDVTFEKNMECGPFNGKTVNINGPVAGKIPNVSSCVEYEEAEGLVAGELAVTLTGEECFEGEAETSITVE
jgi:hypothetical protein